MERGEDNACAHRKCFWSSWSKGGRSEQGITCSNKVVGHASSCPMHLLSDFKTVRIWGMDVNVPKPPEKMLVFRYGEGWKKPVKGGKGPLHGCNDDDVPTV
eukprot:TRINITY_DN4440_c0_g1_i1.p4 TRINITY_DN4440_c0_g1~~TRINITY_DN4440_c0_g1_i1.p4  ORF type:complete len:101 (-),score=44.26 TRINITY_DN4440_c0_g1_i1:84-386(-)